MEVDSPALTGVVCPLCEWTGPSFEPMGPNRRPNALCPRCSSLERHRAMYLYLRDETEILTSRSRVLHFAPEPAMRDVFEHHPNIEYVTTDLEMHNVSLRMDITDLLFRDGVFDCVICSHVLEHVPDDRAALREIMRVLRPDGLAIVMVPILNTPGGVTQEDPSIITPEARLRAYGQADHVRAYGADFAGRVAAEGIDVTEVRYPEALGAVQTKRHGLEPSERIFLCRPPSDEDGRSGLRFDRTVSPGDTMMNPEAPERYFEVGLDALRVIREAIGSLGLDAPERILDLPCGHGRVLRMLRAAYPAAEITACDTDRQGVEFCERTFGADGVVADPSPDQLDLPGPFDLIWCGSLITHLPEPAVRSLLRAFARELDDGGTLIFTTHGQRIHDLLEAGRLRFAVEEPWPGALCQAYRDDGFAFLPYSHSRDGDYGIALAARPWTEAALADAGLKDVFYGEADWDGRQDVVICRRR